MTNGADLSPQLEASLAVIKERREQQEITVRKDVAGPLEFSSEQVKLLRNGLAPGATELEFQMLMEVAKFRRLNPFLKQIHFVKRKSKDDNGNWRETWTSQVSIDGLRSIAQRTGLYDGQDEPEYEHDKDGLILSAKVKVYRKDWSRPAVGVARWSEYVQTTREGNPTKFWATMPYVMIGKCAEALALRKAFPEDLGGIFADEEMQQAENERPALAHPRAMHTQPGENADAPDKESPTYDDIMKTLAEADKVAFDVACTREQVEHWRPIVGRRGEPSSLCKLMSDLIQGDLIGPGQRQALGKLWNRVDRKLTQLELKLPQADGTEVFQPAKSEEA